MTKRNREPAPAPERPPGWMDRLLANRTLTIAAGVVVVVAFALVGILIVTLLGGDDLSKDNRARVPGPLGPAPAIERSAAAELLQNKTWDEMTAEERALVESETERVFDEATFRSTSDLVLAIDIFRRDGMTKASRQYQEVEAPNGKKVVAEVLTFNCGPSSDDPQAVRYLLSAVRNEVTKDVPRVYRPAWNESLSGVDWSAVTDLGVKTSRDGVKVRGYRVRFQPSPQTAAVTSDYWFDVENARLIEQGSVFADDDASTAAARHYLSYDELSPPIIPADLERPDCVPDLMAKLGG